LVVFQAPEKSKPLKQNLVHLSFIGIRKLTTDPVLHDPTGSIKEPRTVEKFLFRWCPARPQNALAKNVIEELLARLHE
jgi:hypothetical protein